ncbi:hypothetical protein C9374_014562 [Naegleria lovaniensis]|uniref:Uncharacterized protein n=1 Tax=Naegleria lovaniensis TaxID=51637 RepID=A0AA88GY18_NAELO|nr:uncharacterized protein C9374_014562 [Naegleria lovaniensis]KAG2389162.1 hypothetical protein C9374_014562 [Naegleria lovaniensis]
MPNRKPLEFHNSIKFTRKDNSNSILASTITDCNILTNIDVEGLSHDVIKKSNVLKFEITLECKSKTFVYKPNRYYCLIELYDPKNNTLLCTQEGNSLLSKETMSTLYKINDQCYGSQLKVNIEKVNRGTRAIFKISLMDRERSSVGVYCSSILYDEKIEMMKNSSCCGGGDDTSIYCDIEWQSGSFLIQDRNSKKRKQKCKDANNGHDHCESSSSVSEQDVEMNNNSAGGIGVVGVDGSGTSGGTHETHHWSSSLSSVMPKIKQEDKEDEENRVQPPLLDQPVTNKKKKKKDTSNTPLTKKIKTESQSVSSQIKTEKQDTCKVMDQDMSFLHLLDPTTQDGEKVKSVDNNKENIPLSECDLNTPLNVDPKDPLLLPMMMMMDQTMLDHHHPMNMFHMMIPPSSCYNNPLHPTFNDLNMHHLFSTPFPQTLETTPATTSNPINTGFNLLYPIPPPLLPYNGCASTTGALPLFHCKPMSNNNNQTPKKKKTIKSSGNFIHKQQQHDFENQSKHIPPTSLLCTSPLSSNLIEEEYHMNEKQNILDESASSPTGNSFLDFSFNGGDSCSSLLASLDGALTPATSTKFEITQNSDIANSGSIFDFSI